MSLTLWMAEDRLDCSDRIFFEIGIDPQFAIRTVFTTQTSQSGDALLNPLKDWRDHSRLQSSAAQFQVVEDFLLSFDVGFRALHDSSSYRNRIPGQ